ncbi:MAG: RDD family protein [Chloroflexota bacterium]|nr:RDD family protein [Chloroflexota bacterium]
MTSDERHGITDLDHPSELASETALEPQDDTHEAAEWDLEAEPAGRTLAPAADGPAPGVRYVEFPVRAAAFALDAVLLTVVTDYTFRAVYTFIFSGILPEPEALGAEPRFAYLVLAIALLTVVAGQAVVYSYLVRVFRATPGQMAFGLFTVSHRDGSAVSRPAAFVRWLLLFAPLPVLTIGPTVVAFISQVLAFVGRPPADSFAPVSTLAQLAPAAWFVVLIVSVFLDERGRGLHDHLSGSVVVRRDGPLS